MVPRTRNSQPHWTLAKSLGEFFLRFGQGFLRQLSFGDIHGNARHAFGKASFTVREASPRADPACLIVLSNDSKFCVIVRVRGARVSNGFSHPAPIVGM